jgi:hypothetical protein
MFRTMKSVLVLCCLFAMARAAEIPAGQPGLHVSGNVLMHAGQPYRGIGANYFSLFSRILKDPGDESSLKNLAALGKSGVPFVRFMCGGFWPTDMGLYQNDKAAYFRRLDQVVRAAEQAGIGLIPSLFWNPSTVADLCGEPLDQYGNSESKSIAFIRHYTAEVVTRYKDSPAVWAWEFGNEYNLGADLPNAAQHRPPVWPQLGTPSERSARDELKWPQIEVALRAFAETARGIDPHRAILNGNSIPRQSAWHNANGGTWQDDDDHQFSAILRRDNPPPLDVMSVHIYPDAKNHYAAGETSLDGIIAATQRHAKALGKPLFIGEFGVPETGGRPAQEAVFDEFLQAIRKHQVPLAAFWVFDLSSQDREWNVTFQNDRAWMIDRVAKANRANQPLGKPDQK